MYFSCSFPCVIRYRNLSWDGLLAKELPPPFVPPVSGKEDTGQVAAEFTSQDVAFTPTGAGSYLESDNGLFKEFDNHVPSKSKV